MTRINPFKDSEKMIQLCNKHSKSLETNIRIQNGVHPAMLV